MKIHTSSWDVNRPSNELLEWLSERTSGYCGADLKVSLFSVTAVFSYVESSTEIDSKWLLDECSGS